MLEEADAPALNLKEKKSNNDRVQAALFTHEQQELEMQGQLTSDPILLVPENFDSPPENYQDLNEEGFELKRHSTPSTPRSKRRLKNSPLSSRKLERRHLQSSAASQLNSFNAAIIDLVKQAAVVTTPETNVQSEEDKDWIDKRGACS